MAKNCFVYETLNAVTEMQSTRSEDGLMHLKGTFGVCGVKNNNARIYEAGNYGKMVAEMKHRLETKPILGELEHPSTMNITLENVSHKITDINIDENGVVSGEIVLLNTPKGKIAQAIVEGGGPLFISSRAQGNVDPRTSVVTLENLATYDLVGSPGFSQAEMHLDEGYCAESICESVGYVYNKAEQIDENQNQNEDMDQKVLERLDAMEAEIKALKEENTALKEAVEAQPKQMDLRKLCEGIQKWVVTEFAPTIQDYMVEHYSPEVQKWVIESVMPEIEKWVVESYSPEIEKWVVESYTPEVQNWCQGKFAEGIQNWFVDECAPEFEKWVVENYGAEVGNKITEAVEKSKKNSMSNIENTLSMLEGLQAPAKPAYPGAKPSTLVVEANGAKYINEMPADARVKWDLASDEVKESINRRAKLFDFANHTVLEFWNGVNFDAIKPTPNLNENINNIQDAREKMIRQQLADWKARH